MILSFFYTKFISKNEMITTFHTLYVISRYLTMQNYMFIKYVQLDRNLTYMIYKGIFYTT